MINLTGTADILRVTLGNAVNTDYTVHYVDITTTATTPGRQLTQTTTAASNTTICSAPAASTQRLIKSITICAFGGAQTVVLQYYDGTNARQLIGGTTINLASGETLEYTDTNGFNVLDGSGAVKTTGVGAGRLIRTSYIISGSAATFNHVAGAATCEVEGVGGGGAGGGASSGVAGSFGSCGGAGTWGKRTFTVTATTSTYTCGAAGTGVSAANGNAGSNSTWQHDATTLTLPGGTAGLTQSGGAGVSSQNGGGPATAATNADFSITGIGGGEGARTTAANTITADGGGGSNPLGQGAPASFRTTAIAGRTGTGYGAGGGGAHSPGATTANAGGNGTIGAFIVREYS